METLDRTHSNLSEKANDGHGGVHVCHKCGWPYPNHHPSAKQRRTHKKVCGNIEGHRLDNDARGTSPVEGNGGDHNSDDDLKTPSEKAVEGEKVVARTISSSGVGSKSSRSFRSEEDVFTDAVTEFNESSGSVTGEASAGALQRFYSMQNGNELDDTETAVESSTGADKPQTFPRVEEDNDMLEAGVGSKDSTSSSLVSAAVASESEIAVDQNTVQSSESFSELDIVSERGKDILSSKDESDARCSYSGTPEEVAEEVSILEGAGGELKGFNNEALDTVSAGVSMKAALMETDGVEDNNGIESLEKDKIDSGHEVNSYYPVLQIRDIDSLNSNIRESDLVEDCDLNFGENVYIPPVLDPVIATGKLNISEANNSGDVSAEDSKAFVVHEGGLDIDRSKTRDNDRVLPEDVDLYSVVDEQDDIKSVDEHDTFQVEDQQISDTNSSTVDIMLRSDVITSENTFPEDAALSSDHFPEAASNADFDHKDGEHATLLVSDGSEVPENSFAVGNSMFAKPAIDEGPAQDLELINAPNSGGTGIVDNIAVEAAFLNEKEMSGGVAENVSTEIRPASGFSVGGSNDSLDHSKETDKIADHGVLDKISDSGDITAAHSLGEGLLTSEAGGVMKHTSENELDDSGTDAVVITDDRLSSTLNLTVEDGDENFRVSSAVVNEGSNAKFTEETSDPTEGDGGNKQNITVQAIDTIVDTSSQADSLDGNWGSVSVMSATSDAQPTPDSIASNIPRALEKEESPVIVPKPEIENQQMSVKPVVGIEQIETVSEIQASKDQHIHSAVQTVADVANEPVKGKKDKEIISKVANWDSGKQHGPLKALLGEATARSREESPIHHNQNSSSTPIPQDVINTGTNRGSSATTESILHFKHPEVEASHEDTGKEWNSPARYPVNIKSEKKRTKSKPSWMPFFCCSSVNAR